MKEYKAFISKRLISLGVSTQDAESVGSYYQSQIAGQGLENAMQFFKRIGDCILHYLYRSPARPDWVRLTKSGFPVGVYCLKKYPEEVLQRIAKFSRAISWETPTPKQVQKVTSAPPLPFTGSWSAVDEMTAFAKAGLTHYDFLMGAKKDISSFKMDYVVNCFQRYLSSSGTPDRKDSQVTEPPFMESLTILAKFPVLQVPGWESAFWPMRPEYVADLLEKVREKLPLDYHPVAGGVYASQEQGGKLRMFASPFSIVQILLGPIHYWVSQFRDTLPTDCTFDQESGAVWAQSKLIGGKTVHSTDLSTATCRFPLHTQLSVLRMLGLPEPWLDALHSACRSDWRVSRSLRKDFGREFLNWEVGQPLGLQPSMSMFSFTHNMLLTGICTSQGLVPEDTFRVLGDDVVISEDSVHRVYISLMDRVGVPISYSKCHDSSRYAEFAGASISRTSLLRPGQWKKVNYSNVIGIAESLGVPTYSEVSTSWSLIQEVYLFKQGKFTPSLPKWPLYIRLASQFDQFEIDRFFVPRARYRYNQAIDYIREKVSAEYPEFFGSVGPYFLRESPNLISAAFGPVEAISRSIPQSPFSHLIKLDKDNCFTLLGLGYGHVSNPWLVASSAFNNACRIYETGYITFEELKECMDNILSGVLKLLWLPPKKG